MKKTRRKSQRTAALLAGALALSAATAWRLSAEETAAAPASPAAAAPRADAPPPPGGHDGRLKAPALLTGTVESFNYGPHGSPSGIMLKADGKVMQVNCPPDVGVALLAAAPVGDEVKVTAIEARAKADHPVYHLIQLTNSKGQSFVGGPGAAGAMVHLEGTVKTLNYGPHGDVDGAILDSGDFVLIGPPTAEALKLAPGQKLTLDGSARPMLVGHNIIQATTVNGFAVMAPPPHDGHPPEDGPEGEGGPHHGPPDHGPRAHGHRPPPDEMAEEAGPERGPKAHGHRPPPPDDEQGERPGAPAAHRQPPQEQ